MKGGCDVEGRCVHEVGEVGHEARQHCDPVLLRELSISDVNSNIWVIDRDVFVDIGRGRVVCTVRIDFISDR